MFVRQSFASIGRRSAAAALVGLLAAQVASAQVRGQLVAGAGQTLGGIPIRNAYDPSLNNLGDIAFTTDYLDGALLSHNGIFKSDGTRIAATGDVVGGGVAYSLGQPSINDGGVVVFRAAGVSWSPFTNGRIMSWNGASLTRIVGRGDTFAGGPVLDVGSPSINNAGRIVFVADIDGLNGGRHGVFDSNGNALVEVGDVLDGRKIDFIARVVINNAGDVAFSALYTDGTGNSRSGIFLTDGTKLVETGDVVAGKTLTFINLYSFGFNSARVVSFFAEWQEAVPPHGQRTVQAMLRTDGTFVAAAGDVIAGGPINLLYLYSVVINDLGDAAVPALAGEGDSGGLCVFRLTQAEQTMPAGALVPYLKAYVDSLTLSEDARKTLDNKLDDVYAAYLANRPHAITGLNGVINYVEAQTGKGISPADADRIILAARTILLRAK